MIESFNNRYYIREETNQNPVHARYIEISTENVGEKYEIFYTPQLSHWIRHRRHKQAIFYDAVLFTFHACIRCLPRQQRMRCASFFINNARFRLQLCLAFCFIFQRQRYIKAMDLLYGVLDSQKKLHQKYIFVSLNLFPALKLRLTPIMLQQHRFSSIARCLDSIELEALRAHVSITVCFESNAENARLMLQQQHISSIFLSWCLCVNIYDFSVTTKIQLYNDRSIVIILQVSSWYISDFRT